MMLEVYTCDVLFWNDSYEEGFCMLLFGDSIYVSAINI
jgi:hypothetical protein